MRITTRVLLAAVFPVAMFPALALVSAASHADPATSFAAPNLSPTALRSLAATCAPCHGTGGKRENEVIPGLAGGNKDFFIGRMQAFKDGQRQSTVMQQLARGYDATEIAALGEYFAAQKK